MRLIERELVNGRAPETNIIAYAVRMAQFYERYAAAKLSMNYFTYYEVAEESGRKDVAIAGYQERYNAILQAYLKKTEQKSVLVERIKALRDEVTEVMKGITAWVDIFNLYEYCLNRVEYRFEDVLEILPEDEELARDILQYIVKENDQVVINTKISECIRQLPIRMTKAKFFCLLREGMSVYNESQKQSVNDLVYMIRTVSMLEQPESIFELSSDLNEIYQDFKKTDFKTIEEEQYKKLVDKLQYATDYIQTQADIYLLLAENINALYVMLLASSDYLREVMPSVKQAYESGQTRSENEKDFTNCLTLLGKEEELFLGEDETTLMEEIENGFLFLEGKQEKYGMLCQKYGYLIENIKEYADVLQSLAMVDLPEIFTQIEKLISGSVFVSLQEETQDEIAGAAYVSQKASMLEEEFTHFFETNDRMVNRAVMAHVLSELPVSFQSLEELKDYVLQSLNGCRDIAEKIAVAEIMKQMTE